MSCKGIILSSSTEWLDDKVIHKAQQLIKKKLPNIDGFQDPVLYDHFVPVKGKFVQVLNVNKNHWFCVAGEGNNEIHIYDSLLIKIDNKSMHVTTKMLKYEDEVFLTKTVPVQKQSTSSRPEVFCKKGVLRNFAKFTGRHLCQGLFFNKVAGPCNFFRKETLAQVFFCEFCKISNNTFSYRHLRWLLLFIL